MCAEKWNVDGNKINCFIKQIAFIKLLSSLPQNFDETLVQLLFTSLVTENLCFGNEKEATAAGQLQIKTEFRNNTGNILRVPPGSLESDVNKQLKWRSKKR